MTKGAVWLSRGSNIRRLRRQPKRLDQGNELHLYYNARVLNETATPAKCLYDLGDYSVWHKPFGMWSQGSKWGDHCALPRWAERHDDASRTAFVVHRLDRAATGIMLLAHTKSMARALSTRFRERQVDKRYRVYVLGDFRTLDQPVIVTDPLDGRAAHSEFYWLRTESALVRSEIEAKLKTGRKHQIRRHLSDLGFPVLGDRLYGLGERDDCDLALVAWSLSFECPIKKRDVTYTLENPPDFPQRSEQ